MAHAKAGSWIIGSHAEPAQGKAKTLALKRCINAWLGHWGLRIRTLRCLNGTYRYTLPVGRFNEEKLKIIRNAADMLCGRENVSHCQ